MRNEFSVNVLLSPVCDHLRSEGSVLVERVLELFADILDDERRPLGLYQVQCFSVVAEFDGINPNKVDLALELLGDGSDGFDNSVFVFRGRVKEDVGERFGTRGVDLIVLATDLVDDGDGEFLNPFFKVCDFSRFGRVGVFDAALVKAAVDNNGGGSYTGFGNSFLVGS